MDKKGFTLIEVIAVIVIIGIIALITVPTVDKLISNSKDRLYEEQVEMIETASKKWGIDNINILPEDKCYIEVKTDLVDKGYLDGAVVNPKNNEEMNDYVIIELGDFNQYEYQYVTEKDASIEKCG